MVLDDPRCGLDASSLHRATSMDISLYKNFRLLSCNRDTSRIARTKQKKRAKPKSLRLSPKNCNKNVKTLTFKT